MAQAELKTKPTDAGVAAFVDAIENATRKADAFALLEVYNDIIGMQPVMWGPSIIGYGSYHYKYDSGREGDMCRIGFSPRKGNTVLYLVDGFDGHAALLEKLGKHKTGKSCLYIKRLSDVDESVLEQLVVKSLTYMAQKYPE